MTYQGLDVPLGSIDMFTVGRLTYRNGVTGTGSNIDRVDLNVSVWDGLIEFTHGSWQIGIVSTTNLGVSPEQDADYIYFPDYPEFGSFRGWRAARRRLKSRRDTVPCICKGLATWWRETVSGVLPSPFRNRRPTPHWPASACWALLLRDGGASLVPMQLHETSLP
jgi:hypothetical protein